MRVVVGLVAALTLVACGGTTNEDRDRAGAVDSGGTASGSGGMASGSGGTAGVGAAACDAPREVFRKMAGGALSLSACALAACHDAQTAQSGINLAVEDPFPALVDKPTDKTGPGSACSALDLSIVDSNLPEQSLIYLKLASSTPPCGLPMPFPLGSTDDGQAATCVLSWIEHRLASR